MMNFMRYVFLICVIGGLVACGAAPAQDASLTEAEVVDAIHSYDAAWSQRDTATVARLLADTYVYFSSVGDIRRRSYMLVDLLGNPTYQLVSDRSELEVQLYGNTAIVGSRWQGTGTYEGEPVRDDQRCSLVLVKRADALRIASEHCTQIATP